jgi:hypothetical protein
LLLLLTARMWAISVNLRMLFSHLPVTPSHRGDSLHGAHELRFLISEETASPDDLGDL